MFLHSRSGVPADLVAPGGRAFSSPKVVVQHANIIITMLSGLVKDADLFRFHAEYGNDEEHPSGFSWWKKSDATLFGLLQMKIR